MITPELRDKLRCIQAELKSPLPANLHEVREIPGNNKKWIFLPWQVIRERLDEIVPEWTSDYSEIQYMNNDAICRCTITILGVRKEAIASVPISVKSNSDNEMTRGMVADRLAAEGFKNAAESWGLGRYLDDQKATAQYLWDSRHQISDKLEEEIRKLCQQYGIHKMTDVSQPKNATKKPLNQSVNPVKKQSLVSASPHPQDLRIREIRTLLNYPTELIVEWLNFQNAKRPSDLELKVVDELVKGICLSWAGNKFDHPNHAANSYQKHVLSAMSNGVEEIQAIRDWISYVMANASKVQMTAQKK